jgi:2'-5' RNA ligase
MRVFAGLSLPRNAIGSVRLTIDRVRSACGNLGYVRPEGLHITIHFFGDIGDRGVDALVRLMNDPLLSVKRIDARLGGISYFPERGNPRVIFVELDEGAEGAVSVYEAYHDLIGRIGYRMEERDRFVPHITIARNRGARIDTVALCTIDTEKTAFVFDRIVLFRSVLGPGGATYTPLATRMFT